MSPPPPHRGLSLDPPLQTSRLLLRSFSQDDLDAVHDLRSDPEVLRYIPWQLGSFEDSRQWLRRRIDEDALRQEGDAVAWAVERRADGRLLGSVNLWWRSDVDRHGEIGFVLHRNQHGRGYAGEAVRAVIGAAFERLDLHRISGRTDARNGPSARLMSRLGMRAEAHLREDEWFKGEWSDTLIYAVLRREWS